MKTQNEDPKFVTNKRRQEDNNAKHNQQQFQSSTKIFTYPPQLGLVNLKIFYQVGLGCFFFFNDWCSQIQVRNCYAISDVCYAHNTIRDDIDT